MISVGKRNCCRPGRKRNVVLARADALEVTIKAFTGLNHRHCSRRNATRVSACGVEQNDLKCDNA
jgi:hypothetical protein